jgi:hypothetical protein
MRRCLLLLLLPALAWTLGAAGGAVTIRGTPMETLERFKAAFARDNPAGEWETLSPGFKARMSRMAGRVLDVGDYIAVRNAHRNDPRIRELRQWLPTAHMTNIHYDGKGYASVIIRFGAPLLLGKDFKVTMVNHKLWELHIRGEAQPYWGFSDDNSIKAYFDRKRQEWLVVTRDKKGKITWQKRWPKDQGSYRTLTRWYFHSFGEVEQQFLKDLR